MTASKFLVLFATLGVSKTVLLNGSRRDAQDLADQIIAVQESALTPTADSTTTSVDLPGASYLRATINGRRWEATEMSPDLGRSSIIVVHGRNKDGFLTFKISGKKTRVGMPRTFKDTDPAAFWDENNETWQGTEGKRVVNKFDDEWVEGTFHFTAEKNGKTVVCTDGEFRVPNPSRAMPR